MRCSVSYHVFTVHGRHMHNVTGNLRGFVVCAPILHPSFSANPSPFSLPLAFRSDSGRQQLDTALSAAVVREMKKCFCSFCIPLRNCGISDTLVIRKKVSFALQPFLEKTNGFCFLKK
ncbi:hypothetical protein CEXT_50691 [Caerostris extrusa]|uniref:Uncharacterized protein n=1 Tax=Caerostris extrusa TaxID=172846 RepID=A0AAV4UNC1_CAEEX|nr:hypothetical protein CEXT_50691 [Caerostris extrusa]